MAINPIVHNDGGVNRFLDYLSTVPEFLKVEDDVVSMLQLFSDYINNAYRNTTIVDKFRFKLIATDNNVVATQNEMERLANLFRLTEARSLKMLYLSKPQGNARAGSDVSNHLPKDWPIYREYIEYDGTLASLGVSTITIPNPEDGDKFFIEFTREGEEGNTGVYVYNQSRNLLQLDPYGSSQDPFNGTVNTPSFTKVGLAPRMLEFNVSDVGEVAARRAGRDGTVTYYEVFFDATIFNIQDITSIVTKNINNRSTNNQDFDYVIDYYESINDIPSSYEFKYDIGFAEGCNDIDWGYSEKTGLATIPGNALFYARDLTDIDQTNTLLNREGRNVYNDPIFDLNTSANDIIEIEGNGIDITVKTRYRHSLSENDKLSITGTINFNGNYTVSKVIDYNIFRISNTTVGSEQVGKIVNKNLFYSKLVDNPKEFDLVLPYIGLDGDREFEVNDFIVRIKNDIEPLFTKFDASTVDTTQNLITVKSLNGFPNIPVSESVKVTVRGDGTGTLPTGITEGIIYDMFIYDKERRLVSFSGVNITAIGSGNFDIYYEGGGRRYFDASAGIDIGSDAITLSNVDGLYVGANIYFRTVSPNITLPTPLETFKAYQISEIDTVTNSIKLDGVDITATGSGVCDLSLVLPNENDSARIDSILIEIGLTDTQDGKGKLTLKSFNGDVISTGFIGRYDDKGVLKSFARINTTTTKWTGNQLFRPELIGGTPPTFPIYQKGDLVVYEGVQYRVVNTIQINSNSRPPIDEPSNYERFMDPIISRPKSVIYNPYMFGLYDVNAQGFGDEIDFTQPYSTLGKQMFIQQVEDLALRYGFDQRQWLFNPRFAPQESVVRNGYIEFVKNSNEMFDPVNSINAPLSVSKANTLENNELFGVNTAIVRTVNSLTTASGIATVTTVGEHGYKSGSVITIQGSSLSETNGSFIITVTGVDTFTYSISNPALQVATGTITSIYQVNVGDFINVIAQDNPSENGIYTVKVGSWLKYDDTKLSQPAIVFCKQNLFTIGELNTEIAKGELITPSNISFVGSGVVQVTTLAPHGYTEGTTIEIRDAIESDYNGRFEVENVVNEFIFQYQISDALSPSTPASGDITCQADAWYQYRLDEIEWQDVSKLDATDFLNSDGTPAVVIPFDSGNNNVDLLSGTYSFTKSNGDIVEFSSGLIVNLQDQLISVENGIYRVKKGLWERLDTKLSMKIRDMRINAYDNPDFVGLELNEEEVVYRTFSDAEAQQYINDNTSSDTLIYRVAYPFAQNFSFVFEKVEEIDTAGSIDRQYNAKKDYNSVVNTADMAVGFEGIPDMDYPLVEKIERIAYNKDPRAIDLQLIQYLARYMGYDLTDWADDIVQSPYYSNPEEVEAAIRRAVEQLPQYYALKSTESGLELLLLTLGIVGELITMWTPQNDPYSEFIPDYKLRGREYADMQSGLRTSYVPTPHFAVNVNIAGNFENQILQGDQQRLLSAINRFKPINTVFNGIRAYIEATLKARITISKMNAKGSIKASIGFETLDWTDDLIDNDCL